MPHTGFARFAFFFVYLIMCDAILYPFFMLCVFYHSYVSIITQERLHTAYHKVQCISLYGDDVIKVVQGGCTTVELLHF